MSPILCFSRKSKMDRQHNGQKKRTKGQTMIYKTLHRNLNSSNANTHKNRGELRCSGRVGSTCSTSDTRRVNLVTNPVTSHDRGKDRMSGWTTYVIHPGIFFIENFMMAEIVQPSDKIKLIFILF